MMPTKMSNISLSGGSFNAVAIATTTKHVKEEAKHPWAFYCINFIIHIERKFPFRGLMVVAIWSDFLSCTMPGSSLFRA